MPFSHHHVDLFHQLHGGPALLILPNVWDGGSARLMASLGARAIATTSSGVAWSRGYPDGDQLPVDLYVQTVRDIVRAVNLPVSVDAEGGYALEPVQVSDNIARLVDAGAVGINLEDGALPVDAYCRKIEAAAEAGQRHGVRLFVNARTDVFLRGLAPGREVEEVIARADQFARAGASGLFIPGATDAATIRAVVAGVSLPVNCMARAGLPPAAELQAMGVRRLSAGGAINQNGWATVRQLGRAFLDGDMSNLFDGPMTWPELNALMQG